MERNRIICLFLFVGLILVVFSCHVRHVSDIKPRMTKEEVVSAWGGTDLVSYKTTDGTTLETWEYHFAGSGSICRITFIQDRVATNPQCGSPRGVGRYYSQSEQTKGGPRSIERSLMREGFFALKLAEALKIGQAESEAEAENMLASVDIAPKNGWIADHPVTPEILEQLHIAVAAAADSGKLALNKSEATEVFENLVIEIESQYARVNPSHRWQPYPEIYYYPYPYPFYYSFLYPYPYYYPYPYPYYYPYAYYYGGYYGFYRPYYYSYRYPHYNGGRGGGGHHGSGRSGGGSYGSGRGGGGPQGAGRSGRR